MEDSTKKEKVLKKIRNALIHKNENPYQDINLEEQVYQPSDDPLEIQFAEAFTTVAGQFIYCADENEFLSRIKKLAADREWGAIHSLNPQMNEILDIGDVEYNADEDYLKETRAGITFCEFLVARLGSVLVSSAITYGRRAFIHPEVHIVFSYSSQLMPDLKEAMAGMQKKYRDNLPSLITNITGPSRTADIEKTLVMGAHGPKELIVFMIDDKDQPVIES